MSGIPGSLHHARLLIGSLEGAKSYFRRLCKDWNFEISNNPDFFAFELHTFGIDEARELKLLATRKAISDRKVFFIVSSRLTLEAQNALLKTFEDTFPQNYFFMAAREEELIIPTLRSRMQVTRVSKISALESNDAEKFLSLPIKDRLLFAKEFADKEKDLAAFLDSLLSLLRQRKGSQELIEKVYRVRNNLRGPMLLPRLVIEHLSLVL